MKKTPYFVFGIFIGLFLAGGIWIARLLPRGSSQHQMEKSGFLQVEVSGAVAQPGVYFLKQGSRVLDAVAAAGGLLPEADRAALNLAATLYNTQRLEIPYITGELFDGEQDNSQADPVVISTPGGGNNVKHISGTPNASFPPSKLDSCSEEVIGSGVFVWPTENHFLSGNGYSAEHPGIDIAAGEGAPVYAADSGVVRLEGNDDSGYGNMIQIDHGNGYSTTYAHLSVIGVKACQSVFAGQWIGSAGNTGNSSGAHLHFEVTRDGSYIDPWSVLPKE
jgi:murein DD-endopeptidase MepM/ murein hydrolase activator NlpD